MKELFTYFHPTKGGPLGSGYPFGRAVMKGDIFAIIQRVHGVDRIEDVELCKTDPISEHRSEPVTRIDLRMDSLVLLTHHDLKVVS